jgi:hypothetical protein
MSKSEMSFPCAGCGTPIYTIGGRMSSCPCQEQDRAEEEKAFRELMSAGDARCNFCDGPMPCHCPEPKDFDPTARYAMTSDGEIRRVRD